MTCRNRKWFRQDEDLIPEVQQIHFVPAWDWRSLRLKLSNNGSPVVRQSIKQTFWGRWLATAQDSFPFSLLLGDGGLVYIWLAYRQACRVIRQHNIQYLFTSYRPFADHWVGYLLKLRFPKLYWIADFRDLHVDPTRHNVYWPGLQNSIDQWLLKRADLVTTVSHGLARLFPVESKKLHILRNAIPSSLLDRQAIATPKFTISYTGAIYPGLQDAKLLFEALTSLLEENRLNSEHLQLVYLGKDGIVWDEWMREYDLIKYSSNPGETARAEALIQQSNSSLNLLLSWSSPQLTGILTSKVYEYLSSGVPTLTIIKGPKDAELEALVEGTGGGRVFYAQPDQLAALKQYLLGCYEEWRQYGIVKSESDLQKLQRYGWPEQVKEFQDSLRVSG